MAVYRPVRNGVRSKFYICEFSLHEKRFQESTRCTSKVLAKEYEKQRRAELERAALGLPTDDKAKRVKSVSEIVDAYLVNYALAHRPASLTFARARLRQITNVLGSLLLAELNEERVHSYIKARKHDGVSGRTINMELGELSRALGRTWRELWPRVKKLEEKKDVGRALSWEEQQVLLGGLSSVNSQALRTLIPTLLLTGMRVGEAISLRWSQIDLFKQTITVGRAKTSSGTGRIIPMNVELAQVISAHRFWFAEAFGEPDPNHFVFPFGHPRPTNPWLHITDIKWAWNQLRRVTGISCRLHDLRHTFATNLAEHGTSESTMLALMGHMSRAMLERYSHIRMTAKVEAVGALTLGPKSSHANEIPVKTPVSTGELAIQ